MELQGHNLRSQMKGDDVQQLQHELRQLDYDINDADGFFGKTTRLALQDFQKYRGLPETGVVNKSLSENLEQGCYPGPRSGISLGLACPFEILKRVQDDTQGGFRIGSKRVATAITEEQGLPRGATTSTEDSVLWNVEAEESDVTIEVDFHQIGAAWG